MVVWGLSARNAMNSVTKAKPDSPVCFSALWTCLFTPMYFNYKVNSLAKT